MKTSTITKILRFAHWGAATLEDFLASEGGLSRKWPENIRICNTLDVKGLRYVELNSGYHDNGPAWIGQRRGA